MLDHLRRLAIFAKTVEHGSFRSAARALNLSPSGVSHHIAQLEAQLGVALLYRSTRKLSLTRDGERLIVAAQTIVTAAQDGIATVMDQAATLSGELRVTAPAVLATSVLADKIASFAAAYPNVKLALDYSEDPRDMIADSIDVAIRMGQLRGSQLKATKLYTVERCLMASRTYLKGKLRPKSPKDVENWDWLELSQVQLRPVFRHASHKSITLRPSAMISANNAVALYQLARNGAGLAVLPRFLASTDMHSGTIEEVLSAWRLPALGVFALLPGNAPPNGIAAEFVRTLAHSEPVDDLRLAQS